MNSGLPPASVPADSYAGTAPARPLPQARGAGLLGVMAILAVFAVPLCRAQEVVVADTEVERIETPHPYPEGDDVARVVWSHTLSWPDASFIAVHFDRFELADGDVLLLSDPQGEVVHRYRGRGYRQRGGDFWGLSVRGDTMELRLLSADARHEAYGLSIDRWTHGYPDAELGDRGVDAICGAEDFEDAECYRDTYPTEFGKSRAVARTLKNGAVHCTAWLVSCENHMLTNQHCIASQAELDSVEFQFEYKLPGCGTGTPTSELQLHGGTLLEVDTDLDYALVMPALDGNDPQATYGFLQLDLRIPDDNEQIYIPHHPQGVPRKISIFSSDPNDQSGRCEIFSSTEPPCSGSAPQADIGYYCDTEYGSSGSPVLAVSSDRVVALHHCANCPNRAVPITEVYDSIQASPHPLPLCSTCVQGAPATALSAAADGPNRIRLDWTASADAVDYNIYRSRTSCSGGMEFLASAPGTSFVDDTVSGGVTYSYTVRAVNDCGAEAADSNCAQASTGGSCVDPPLFAGLESLDNERSSTCSIALGWTAATPQCGSAVRYNVYRGTSPGVQPGPATLVASCVSGTGWSDTGVDHGRVYYYVVRAEDDSGDGTGPCASGNEDANAVEFSGYATGPLRAYSSHDFESPSGWTLGGEWQIGAPQGLGGSASGAVGDPDPSVAFAGSGVLGVDLSGLGSNPGSYETRISPPDYAESPPFSAVGEIEALIRFQRWLGVEGSSFDHATVEVFDGAGWQTLWENPAANLSDGAWQPVEIDATAQLAGVPDARIRFGIASDYAVAYCGWNVDRLEVVGGGSCTPAAAGPSPVPDGHFDGGSPMTASRAPTAGEVEIRWDAATCPAAEVNLMFGDSDSLPVYGFANARCLLGASGTAVVAIPDPQPGHFTWWTMAADEAGTESHHGHDSSGAIRAADGTGLCSVVQQDASGRCN